jgi:hypothetical protein
MRSRLLLAAASAASLAAATLIAAPAATAAPPPPFVPVASGFDGPLHIAFGPGRSLYVASAGLAGTPSIDKVDLRTGAVRHVLSPQGFSPGIDVRGNGRVLFTLSEGAGPEEQGPTWLKRINASGRVTTLADMLKIERMLNPDGQDPNAPDAESNPYSVLALPGRTIVADAAGNSLIEIRANKRARVLTAFPTFAAPGCQNANPGVGALCDPVPTDVEMGPDGYLYVSGLGAEVMGHIYKVNARTGAIVQTWGDLPPLTGIDVAPDGTIYVASLFTNQVFRIARNGVTIADIPAPADVELGCGMILVSSLTGSIFSVNRNAFG